MGGRLNIFTVGNLNMQRIVEEWQKSLDNIRRDIGETLALRTA